ncbi:MAG: hypothetical protein IBJ18_01665 [Phycisphaerales bacterium]|nr:hypothetical protein [Phycisphaerales bacterium]
MTQTPEPFIPHCNNCGYSLQGLDHDGKCPECGTAVVLSLPGVRMLKLASDTPWGWYAYVWRMMKNPRAFFLQFWIDPDWGLALAVRMILMAAMQPMIVVFLHSMRFPGGGSPVLEHAGTKVFSMLGIALPLAVVSFAVMEAVAVMIRPMVRNVAERTPLIISQAIARYTTGLWMVGSGVYTLVASLVLLTSWFLPASSQNQVQYLIMFLLLCTAGVTAVLWLRIVFIGVDVFRNRRV